MQNKEIKFGNDSRSAILNGMRIMENAVGSTLGPKGHCVIIDEYSDDKPLITKDGVTVARNIQLKDKFENLGVQLLKEASVRSLYAVGDGTTSSIVIAYNIVKQLNDLISNGRNPIELREQINNISNKIIEEIKKQSISVKPEDIEKIATISANNDKFIGSLIANTFNKIGLDGVITVEESPNTKTYSDIITGMQFDHGYESPYFATDPIKGICCYESCLILLTDQKVQSMRDIVPVLEIAQKKGRPILLIAQDYDDEVIQNLKINKMRNIIRVCAVKAPSYGNYRSMILEDLAILTGAKLISYESGIELQKVDESMLGQCGKIIVTKETTTIIEGKGSKELINQRVAQIKESLNHISSDLDADFLKEFYAARIAKLTGGISVIYVGGTTELEMKEKKDRIDDAVCATKAAIEEGYVVGGGLSFIKALINIKPTNDAEEIIANGCFSIFNKICENSGINPIENVNQIDIANNIGFNAKENKFENLLEAGIINPAKSDRLAFENAISVVNLFLSAHCLITNEEIQF